METKDLLVAEIFADPDFNCRGPIAPFDVIELAKSIEANGLQQPIVVQPYNKDGFKWRVIMGHRRHKAFQVLRRELIPCIVRPDLTDTQARTMNLIENLQRQDLTVMQEARAISKFINMTQEDVSKMLGQSRGWVQVRFMALQLDPLIQNEIDAGFINQTQIREIYSIPSKEGKFQTVREIKDAKIRNEKRSFAPKPKPKKLDEKRMRTAMELYAMQDTIRDVIGNNFGTRCLAFASGEITERELLTDLKALADEKGVPYSIPLE